MKVLELTRSRLAFDIIAGALLAVLCANSVFAQTYGKGRHIEPAFEGWRPNDDGMVSRNMRTPMMAKT